MLNTNLYGKSSTYDFFIRLLQYEKSIDRYLTSLDLNLPQQAKILDLGCGTGLLGLHFLNRLSDSHLWAADLEPNFLRALLANASRRGINENRITTGHADISKPTIFTPTDSTTVHLEPSSFHVICIGAVIGYSNDTEASLRKLLRLLAPNGYLINIEMNEKRGGRYVSRRFSYSNLPLVKLQEIIVSEDCEVVPTRFGFKNLPASFTRTSIVARRPA